MTKFLSVVVVGAIGGGHAFPEAWLAVSCQIRAVDGLFRSDPVRTFCSLSFISLSQVSNAKNRIRIDGR